LCWPRFGIILGTARPTGKEDLKDYEVGGLEVRGE
jgi:hypothetical protein